MLKRVYILIQWLLVQFPLLGASAREPELLVIPNGCSNLRWSFTNVESQVTSIPATFLSDDNNLLVARPRHSVSGWGSEMCFGPLIERTFQPPPMQLPPKSCRIEFVTKDDFANLLALTDPDVYLRYRWWMYPHKFTQHIILGCATDGSSMRPPYVGTAATNAAVHLAFVFNKSEPNDLSFIYLNGDKETNSLSSPLCPESSLVVTSPAIGYSNEVTSAAYASTNAFVAPKMAEHWRIPWPKIWERIPLADRERLQDAGKIDLRWKCGDLVSDPLPLWVGSLDDMTNNPYATGAM